MNMLRKAFFAAALAGLVLAALPAQANNIAMCAPDVSGAASGPRRVTNPNTNNTVNLNSFGCGNVLSQDVGYFLSQGFGLNAPFAAVIASGIANNFTAVLPASTYIRDIIYQETSGATVTGGMFVGSAATTSDVQRGVSLAAAGLNVTSDIVMVKRAFSSSAPQTLFFGAFSAAGSMNQAQVIATVIYGYF